MPNYAAAFQYARNEVVLHTMYQYY